MLCRVENGLICLENSVFYRGFATNDHRIPNIEIKKQLLGKAQPIAHPFADSLYTIVED